MVVSMTTEANWSLNRDVLILSSLVEPAGLEPATSRLQSGRSPN